MTLVVSFEDFTPPARYDDVAWAQIRIDEASTSTGPWTIIDTLTIDPVDADPSLPASRSFTTENGTAADLWYRVAFLDAIGGETEPTPPIRNATRTASVYTTVTELARILKVDAVAREEALERVITTAAGEINAELNLADDDALEEWELQLCATVNLDRAADLWRHTESIPGVLGVLDESMPATPGRYSWERYAQRLSPIKRQWGLA
jgi:hypothetical protein